MLIFQSRQYKSPDEFVEDFLKTITSGIIKRFEFIDWQTLEKKLKKYIPSILFYKELAYKINLGYNFIHELKDSLLASDNPFPLIKCAFELIGHTGDDFVTLNDDLNIDLLAQDIIKGEENKAEYLAILLNDLGFTRILLRNDLEDLFLGVQIGLETHRRKNISGALFQQEIYIILTNIVNELQKQNYNVELEKEIFITYGENLSKKVDFAIKHNDKVRFAIEVNFYTVAGSKPTEIKRSYKEVLNGFQSLGIDLIWITDGKGYRDMKRSLKDAYKILPNIYNLKQVKMYLLSDILSILRK